MIHLSVQVTLSFMLYSHGYLLYAVDLLLFPRIFGKKNITYASAKFQTCPFFLTCQLKK